MKYLEIDSLVGKTLIKIERFGKNFPDHGDEIIFHCSDGEKYKMFHDQDCCESVDIEDITGDLSDLIGSPIIRASEDVNEELGDHSSTWTFYNIATAKGQVTIRWYGESNGFYSERVHFCLL